MFGGIERESANVVRIHGISHETASGMGIQTNHEEECEMMSVPKRFEALLADFVVGGGVHQNHNKEHKVSRNATRLRVVDVKCPLSPNLC